VLVSIATETADSPHDALDAACRDKYGRSSSAVARITADVSRATTLRVDPS
jgi:hypothetical protein